MAEPENKPSEEGIEEIVAGEVEMKVDPAAAQPENPIDFAQRLSGMMQSPEMLAALQEKLGGMVGLSSGYIENLPKVVKRRLKALKKLQFEMIKIESKFYEEVHELECKYAEKYAPLYERRKEIVSGGVEPTDSDCEWPSDEEDEDDEEVKLAKELESKAKVEDGEKKDGEEKEEENPSGVPSFWLTIFKSVDLLSEMVQEHDEPILEALHDVKVEFSKENPMGFTLHFFFSANDYFTNTVLTKEYIMRSEPEEKEPFAFEGPEIIKCKGCTIDWKKGKNVTQKVIKKVQTHKTRGTRRTTTKTVQNDSFFNFFNPPDLPEGEEPDEETESLLAADFEIGHFIRERIVPRAVLYFTGEALEEDEFEEEEGEEGEEDSGEDDEENDPDFVAP